MTIEQFERNYFCKLEIPPHDNFTLQIISKAIRRNDNSQVDAVRTSINIQETNDWLNDSQTTASLNQWDWEKILDQTKRAHLDYFAQRAPIEDFYPLDTDTNQDIDKYYE
jgi:asparagine synthetase A